MTQKFLYILLCLTPLFFSFACAQKPQDHVEDLMTIDIKRSNGLTDYLGEAQAKIVVLDICASWNDTCLLNATMLSQACGEMCGESVAMYSMLLDEAPLDLEAIKSYQIIIQAKQEIIRPGPLTLKGKSALGRLAIPRIVIFDRQGRIIDNIGGTAISGTSLMSRLHELLDN